MSRLPLICANWKMNHTASEATRFLQDFVSRMAEHRSALDERVEIAIAPAHPVLDRLGRGLEGSGIQLAAQNLHAEESGAFTGEVSLSMLVDLGCRYALIGHSERRKLFGEKDPEIAAKALRLQGSPVRPILCVGETLEERDRGATLDVVGQQLSSVLEVADGLGDELVVAYEPVWAIGTGRTATPDTAQEVHAAIRKALSDRLGRAGDRIRILYGGSVNPSNAGELLSQPDIDGALVGGASLDPEAFARIALACLEIP
jgi:triosephosphate isomerase